MNVIDMVEGQQLRDDIPDFKPGDTLRVHVRITEGEKERIQVFEGVCIAQKHGGIRETFTIRKISFGHGVERVFPKHSKVIDKIEVLRQGRVRRAKLYYIRKLRGKAARIREIKKRYLHWSGRFGSKGGRDTGIETVEDRDQADEPCQLLCRHTADHPPLVGAVG